MRYKVGCPCGGTVWVEAALAGSSFTCDCGRVVPIPALRKPRGQMDLGPATIESAGPVIGDSEPLAPPHAPCPPVSPEVIAPTEVVFRIGDGRASGGVALLTPDAVWIQDSWAVRRVPLAGMAMDATAPGTLRLVPDPESGVGALTLAFPTSIDADRWRHAMAGGSAVAGGNDVPAPEGVCLIRGWPNVPHERIGWVESVGPSRRAADGGLKVRAAVRGADAVVRVERERYAGAWRCGGRAVRAADGSGRDLLRRQSYRERARSLANRMFVLLAGAAAAVVLIGAIAPGAGGLSPATGQTFRESLAHDVPWVAALYGWPFLLAVWLRVSGRPGVVMAAGLAVLGATAGRGLAAMVGRIAAARAAAAPPTGKYFWFLVDPVDWAIIAAGIVLALRAGRLAADARDLVPGAAAGSGRARVLLALSAAYLIGFVGLAGWSSLEAGLAVSRPGVDPHREHQALLALNRGIRAIGQNDLPAADRALSEALALWGPLGAGRDAPAEYRANLALTLFYVGVVRDRQGQADQAESNYTRAVEVGSRAAAELPADEDLRAAVADAQRRRNELRDERAAGDLAEKDKNAWAAYDSGFVAARKGDPAARGLLEKAVALWEEILPRATNPEYRRGVTPQLALAYLRVADLDLQHGLFVEAEAALGSSIAHGEAALALGPERPLLVRDNLDLARQMLSSLRERGHRDELNRLTEGGKWAEAEELHRRGIADQEMRAKAGPDRDAAVRSLADRLDRFAWFLAHCPDARIRDPKAAVGHARRAADLQPAVSGYWYTLAVAQHRNGDWRDSQMSLAEVKARDGDLDGTGWFLTAMNLHRLGEPVEARAALKKGAAWADERRRQAETDTAVRWQWEMVRPAVERLRREAERLLDGKDPTGDRIG